MVKQGPPNVKRVFHTTNLHRSNSLRNIMYNSEVFREMGYLRPSLPQSSYSAEVIDPILILNI